MRRLPFCVIAFSIGVIATSAIVKTATPGYLIVALAIASLACAIWIWLQIDEQMDRIRALEDDLGECRARLSFLGVKINMAREGEDVVVPYSAWLCQKTRADKLEREIAEFQAANGHA